MYVVFPSVLGINVCSTRNKIMRYKTLHERKMQNTHQIKQIFILDAENN